MRRFFFLLVFLLPALIIAVLVARKKPLGALGLSEPDAKVLAGWRDSQFESIDRSGPFLAKVQAIPMTGGNKLSEAQRAQLYVLLYGGLLALREGDYEGYRRFRTPVPAKLNPALFNITNREMLETGAKPFLRPGERVPEDFEEYVRLMTSRMNGGRGLTNFWIAVCVTNSFITVERATNPPVHLLAVASAAEKVGLFRPAQFFIPERQPADVLAESGAVLWATVSMVTRPSEPDPAIRVYIRLFWDDKFGCWVPDEYVSAYSPARKWSLIW